MSDARATESSDQTRSANVGSIGARLLAARKQRQLTVDNVARELRLDVSVVRALEHDDMEKLPAPIFVQGYLRSYARLLGLSGDELVDDYTRQYGDLPPLTVSRVSGDRAFFRLPSMRLIRGLVLLILVVALLWLAFPYLNRILESRDQAGDELLPGHLEIPPAEQL